MPSTDHHITAIRIAREIMPDLGMPIPEDLWEEFSFDLGNENAAFNMHQELSFHRRLIAVMDDPLLGLKMGRLFPPQAYGMFGLAFLCADNQRQALRFAIRFAHLAYTLQTLSFHEDEEGGVLEFTAAGVNLDARLKAFFADRDLGAAYFATNFGGTRPLRVEKVTIEHGDFGMAGAYEDYFRCEVEFDNGRNRLFMSAAELDRPNPFRNASAFEICVRECERQISNLAQKPDFATQVRQELLKRPGYLQDIASVARSLGASPRTLRRKLEAAGESFIDLQQATRFQQAQDYLSNPKMPVSEIAEILGYSEPGNFTAAFKRWSGGVSPRAFRRKQLERPG